MTIFLDHGECSAKAPINIDNPSRPCDNLRGFRPQQEKI
jgi:hypothetical protein